MTTKKCKYCKKTKDLSYFSYVNKSKGIFRYKSHCKKCCTKKTREYNKKNPEKAKIWDKRYRDKNKHKRRQYIKSLNGKFSSYKRGAKTRNLPFRLTKEQFCNLLNKDCFYCGKKRAYGIDRSESSKGYLLTNCVPCCTVCNRMKWDKGLIFFVKQIKRIFTNLKETKVDIFNESNEEATLKQQWKCLPVRGASELQEKLNELSSDDWEIFDISRAHDSYIISAFKWVEK